MNKRKHNRQAGFTLIEIMVALLIVSLALGALVSATGRSIDNTRQLKLMTYAQWVAENKATEVLINKGNVSTLGQQTGTEKMAGINMSWKIIISPTPDDSVKKIVVTVSLPANQRHTLATLVTYVNH